MRLERFAIELGFDGFGVTGAGSPKAIERYKEWLNLGYEGEMTYMSRNFGRRSDLDIVFPGVKSVICLRTNYLTVDKDMRFLDEPNVVVGLKAKGKAKKDYSGFVIDNLIKARAL